MHRFQIDKIIKDLDKKIVFIVGPRQVGKTWLSKKIGSKFKNTVYLNYDSIYDREIIQKQAWLNNTELLILDELHKMPEWKNYLKGLFDTKPEKLKIIVTGSARLDVFRQTGDSLAGRFFCHRLMPFSLSEIKGTEYEGDLDRLILRGGFPEPFLAIENVEAKRWRQQYIDGLIRNDLLDFENIHDFKAIKLVLELLRRSVGSTVSYSSIARDVKISPSTVKKYIQVLEALYIVFRVTPFSRNIARSLLKEPKIYFFDTGFVEGDIGAKLENTSAVSLLKHVYALTDYKGDLWELQYLRTKDGREVDFCFVKNDIIQKIIEVKNKDSHFSKNLLYFAQKYNFDAVQIVKEVRQERMIDNFEIKSLKNFLSELYI